MKTQSILAVAVASTVALSGCNSTSLTDKLNELGINTKITNPQGDVYVNSQLQEKPQLVTQQNVQTTQQAQPKKKVKKSWKSFEISQTHPIAVDIAAFAIAREFDYQSPEQIRKKNSGVVASFMVRDRSYRWESSPGSFHNMRRSFNIGGNGYNIDFEILRKTDNETMFLVKYWVRDDLMDNQSSVNEFITTKMERALSKYIGA